LSAVPDIMDLFQGEHPKILPGMFDFYFDTILCTYCTIEVLYYAMYEYTTTVVYGFKTTAIGHTNEDRTMMSATEL